MVEVPFSKRDWGKLFRNIWFSSLVAFFLSVTLLFWRITNRSSVEVETLMTDLLFLVSSLFLTLSILVGSLSFVLWIVIIIGRVLINKFPKYRRWVIVGLVVASVVCIVFLVGLSHFTIGVDGNSMYPAIQNKNNILVNRWTYKSLLPQRGDIVIYKRLSNSGYFQEAIGRIIGVPDETITIKEGHIFINEQKLEENYLLEGVSTSGRSFLQEGQPYQIPSERFIILGDNRDYSLDSREHGQISKENILGKVFYRYWPLNMAGKIGN